MEEIKKGDIIIYRAAEGPEIQVRLENDTVWATQAQIANLFGTQRPAITKHLRNIFKTVELSEKSVCSKMEHTAPDGKIYKTKYYSLDAIIAVGYRVNSKRATLFRVWATEKLRSYLLKGYVVNEQRLREQHDMQMKELEKTSQLFLQVIENRRVDGYEKDLLRIIADYTNTWAVLNKYDQGELGLEGVSKKKPLALDYAELQDTIAKFKSRLMASGQAGELFGKEIGDKMKALLGNIHQTYGGKPLYPSVEERAAHLLYFTIKDHPFADGNKRIGSLAFLLYLLENSILMSKRGERKINDSALAAIALLIAESKPEQKDVMVKLVVNLISRK